MVTPSTDRYPRRIVCLTEETTETLYMLGQEKRIIGISGFTVRPPRAREEKLKVSTFLDARIDDIVALKPDLVIGFSDIQATIATQLIKKGITVWVNNHRSVDGIFNMIAQLGALVGEAEKAFQWITDVQSTIATLGQLTARWPVRPKVYFEEWPDPPITAIQWVSELITLAGGVNVFPEKSACPLAKDRILHSSDRVVGQNPDIIISSWCGKMFKKEQMLKRRNWHAINAVKYDAIYELDSSIILQPGPAAVTEGLQALFNIFKNWTDAGKKT